MYHRADGIPIVIWDNLPNSSSEDCSCDRKLRLKTY